MNLPNHKPEVGIVVVEKNDVYSIGIQTLIKSIDNIYLVGVYKNVSDLLHDSIEIEPDIVLIDITEPVQECAERIRKIQKTYPLAKVIAISTSEKLVNLETIIKAGVWGYVTKDVSRSTFEESILKVVQGEKFICPTLAIKYVFDNNGYEKSVEPFATDMNDKESHLSSKLTPREKEVINQMVNGLTDKEIAGKLFISCRTVEAHKRNIMVKVGARRTVEIVSKAMRLGFAK